MGAAEARQSEELLRMENDNIVPIGGEDSGGATIMLEVKCPIPFVYFDGVSLQGIVEQLPQPVELVGAPEGLPIHLYAQVALQGDHGGEEFRYASPEGRGAYVAEPQATQIMAELF